MPHQTQGPYRILVVEDEALIAMTLEQLLKDRGYEVLPTLRKGEEVLDAVSQQAPDIVLMDIFLAGVLTGDQAVDQLAEAGIRTPVVYLTANSQKNQLKASQQTNVYGFLTKPLNEIELGFVLEKTLVKYHSEQKIHQKEQFLSTILGSMEDGLLILDRAHRITYCNQAARQLLECSCYETDCLNRHFKEVLTLQEKDSGLPIADITDLERENAGQKPYRLLTNSNQLRYLDLKLTPWSGEEHHQASYLLMLRDITDQVRARETSRQTYEMLAGITRHFPGYIYLFDLDSHKATFTNRPVAGLGFQEKQFWERLYPREGYRKQFSGKGAFQAREVSIQEGGTTHQYKLYEQPYQNNHLGETKVVLGIALDISSEKALEKAQQERQVAEKTAKTRQNFLSNMSHEIRNPLNSMLGLLGLMEEEQMPQPYDQYLQTMQAAGQQLRRILDDILSLSRLEQGCYQLRKTQENLPQLAHTIEQLYAAEASQKGLALEVELSQNLPEQLIFDPKALHQVLANLLSNAVKFTEEGQVRLRIQQVFAEKNQAVLHFAVEDSGHGIPEAKTYRLFQKFSRLEENTGNSPEGTGLGLTIVKELVELMGSQLQFKSKPGQGTTFWFQAAFRLPEKAPEKPKPAPNLKSLDAGGALKALIADDQQANRQVASLLFQKMGFQTREAQHGQQVLALLAEEPFDLVVLDLRMPVMDGLETFHTLREHKLTSAPVVALSANARQQDREKFLGEGFDGYLFKPIEQEKLLELMGELFPEMATGTQEAGQALSQSETQKAWESLYQLADGQPDLLKALLESYANDLAATEKALNQAAQAADSEAFLEQAHTLKGLLNTMGLESLSRRVARLEERCKKTDKPLYQLLSELGALFQAAKEAKETFNNELAMSH